MFGVVNAMLVQSSDFLRDIIADIGKILQSDVLNEFTQSAPISASPENEADRVLLINLDCVQWVALVRRLTPHLTTFVEYLDDVSQSPGVTKVALKHFDRISDAEIVALPDDNGRSDVRDHRIDPDIRKV